MASQPMAGQNNTAHFVQWLQRQNSPEAHYALARWNTASGYNMSGHFHSGFPGVRTFLRNAPQYQGTLMGTHWTWNFWPNHRQLERDFAAFVGANWAHFPGQKGGDWRKKLPPRQGGTQTGGGAGSGLVARLFILLDLYGNQHGY